MHPILSKNDLFRKGESIYIQKSTNWPEFIEKMHMHNFIEISYIISGECIHYENNNSCYAKKGDLFIINFGTPHYDKPVKESAEPFLSYDCTFTPDFLDENLIDTQNFLDITSSFLFRSMQFSNNDASPILKLTDSSFNEFEQLFSIMHQEYTAQKKGYYDFIRSCLIQLVIKLFRNMSSDNNSDQNDNQEHFINLATEYIHNNYNKKIALQDIAYRSMLSKSYFCQLFKETTGMSFLKYLQKVRIDHVCDKLKSTDESIHNIAVNSGFEDIKFFYTIFKKETNMTPGEYRQAHKL